MYRICNYIGKDSTSMLFKKKTRKLFSHKLLTVRFWYIKHCLSRIAYNVHTIHLCFTYCVMYIYIYISIKSRSNQSEANLC